MELLTRELNKRRGRCIGVVSVLMTLLVLLVLAPPVRSAPTVASEYQLKAVFLFNFTQFVEWPPESFAESGAPLIIGILGDDPFGAYLDETVRGEMVNGRPLVVQRYRRVDDIKNCHVLFVSRSEAEHLTQVLSSLKGRSILTVSDLDGFTRNGGVIRFATVANKIRLRISLDAAQSAKLMISSKLLRPAEIVGRGE
jgi:hypothetical protein